MTISPFFILNDVANIARYIHYCNSNFEYKEGTQWDWIMSDSYLALSISGMIMRSDFNVYTNFTIGT